MLKALRFSILAFVLTLAARPVQAHPHTWIDLETALIFNEEGKVSGLWVGWLFDDYYSAFTLEEIQPDKAGKYPQEKLDELATINLTNLSEYNYFTFIKADGKQQAIKPVTKFKTSVKRRLWMEFTVELETPIDPRIQKIDYAVYDPTFYIEILHAVNGDPIQMIGNKALGCNYKLVKPEPPKELSLMAAALDKDETPKESIGASFAEQIDILCD